MNALFIGPYRQNDGWGIASREYIKAISSQISNLTTRPVYFIQQNVDPGKQIVEYENSRYKSYDVVFQKTLPHCITIDKKIKKNVGMFFLETNNISKSICVNSLNKLDEILVNSNQEKKTLIESKITTKIKVISQPLDIEFIDRNRENKIDISSNRTNSFKFYSIGEYIERKNFKDLIIAFHLAFKNTDNVSLIIKTSKPGQNSQQAKQEIENDFSQIKKKLNIKQHYKRELVITERLSDEDMIGLHNSCDCFVMPSYGEAFCRPAAEALILGKTPIVTDRTGMVDFINKDNGFIISSKKSPVIVDTRTLSNDFDIYNANEYWFQPNIYSLIECMQKAYYLSRKEKDKYKEKQLIGINSKNQFSYEQIGKNICD
jgi:glycosyltransferase involved in cell wall biosynthesis